MAGLIAAMEEIENEIPVNESEAAETAVAVADESAEIQQDGDEIGTTVAQVEDAVQAGEELESIGEVAVDSVEGGEGLTEEAAEVASIAIESIRNRLGFRTETRLVPATESFGNTNTRVMSTRLVIEGIGDTLKKIWAAIKAAALRVWDMIKSFFNKLFGSATMLSKHIESLRKRARDIPGDAKPDQKKVKSSVAKEFSINGKANLSTAKTIVENTEKMSEVCSALATKQKDVVRAAEDLASAEINEANVAKFLDVQTGSTDAVLKAVGVFGTYSAGLAGLETTLPKKTKGSTDVKHNAFGPFIGNQVLLATITKKEVLGKTGGFAKISFVAAKAKAADELEMLNLNEVSEILGIAQKISNKLADFKKIQGDYEAITKATNKVADTVMKSADNILNKTGSSTETRQGLTELKEVVQNGISTLGSFGQKAPQLMFNTAKALSDYASISMRNLKSK